MTRGRRVLVVGSGGREHALALRLLQSDSVAEVLVLPGNGGTAQDVRVRALGKTLRNITGSPVERAVADHVDLVVVGPEAPLCAGLADQLTERGVFVFGPSRRAAELEGSKAFMKRFAERYGIRTATYEEVREPTAAKAAVARFAEPPVVKADGLCAGKGVTVCESHEQALTLVQDMLSGKAFGAAGAKVIVEERVFGAEASVHAICDGRHIAILPAAQDHKRLEDGDRGPNTGGMGAYAPAPLVSPALQERIRREIIEPAVHGLAQDRTPYRGALFAGIMVTPAGDPVLLEFNVRFGDPETQVLMPLCEGDLAETLLAAAQGRLRPDMLGVTARSAVCVVLAAPGYPEAPRLGDEISGIDEAEAVPGVTVFHAGTAWKEKKLVTSGGRVLGVTAQASTLREAHQNAYRAVEAIAFTGKQVRRDIARRALDGSKR